MQSLHQSTMCHAALPAATLDVSLTFPSVEQLVMPDSKRLDAYRWDADKTAEVDNLVLMTFQEATQHESRGPQASSLGDDKHSKYVHQRLQLVRTEYCLD